MDNYTKIFQSELIFIWLFFIRSCLYFLYSFFNNPGNPDNPGKRKSMKQLGRQFFFLCIHSASFYFPSLTPLYSQIIMNLFILIELLIYVYSHREYFILIVYVYRFINFLLQCQGEPSDQSGQSANKQNKKVNKFFQHDQYNKI